jgi:predicted MFS family arabinose efflux permease
LKKPLQWRQQRQAKEEHSMKRPGIPVLFQISVAHFVSHIHILAIPALLPLLPEAMGVSYVELGAAISVFNIVSALIQAPLGFAVDRFGARKILCLGLAVGSGSYLVLALFPSYSCLIAAMALAGLANGAYHPADYAMLSRSIQDSHMGRAFSVHSFAGFAGAAVTPAIMVTLASWYSIPTALTATGLFGAAAFCILAVSAAEGQALKAAERPTARQEKRALGRSAIAMPIITLTALYVLLNLSTSSIERFSASTLIQGYGVELALANTALTAFLFCSSFGVLGGGLLADRTRRHGYVAASAFGAAAACMVVVAVFRLPPVALVALFALVGFLTGVIVPSRDMLVRAASPKGSEGKVFGIVSTGFNIGGTVGPVLFGLFLDYGLPSMVFWSTVAFMLLTVILTWIQEHKTNIP